MVSAGEEVPVVQWLASLSQAVGLAMKYTQQPVCGGGGGGDADCRRCLLEDLEGLLDVVGRGMGHPPSQRVAVPKALAWLRAANRQGRLLANSVPLARRAM